jgi:uncharacterized protein (DUF433 family)
MHMQAEVFDWRARINIDPGVQSGVLVVKGRRVPLYVLVGHMANGDTAERIAEAYQVSVDDVHATLAFASYLLHQRGLSIPPEEEEDFDDEGWTTLA